MVVLAMKGNKKAIRSVFCFPEQPSMLFANNTTLIFLNEIKKLLLIK